MPRIESSPLSREVENEVAIVDRLRCLPCAWPLATIQRTGAAVAFGVVLKHRIVRNEVMPTKKLVQAIPGRADRNRSADFSAKITRDAWRRHG
jgi:hypothetical protein